MTGVTDIRTASELAECGACEHRARKGGGGGENRMDPQSSLPLCYVADALRGCRLS